MAELYFTADTDIKALEQKLKKVDEDFVKVARDAAQAGTVMDKIFKQAATDSISGMALKLKELQKAYNDLSAADRATQGAGLFAEIEKLSESIENARNQFAIMDQVASDSIDGMIMKVIELQGQFNALSASDRSTLGAGIQKEIQALSSSIEHAKDEFVSMGNVADDSINGMITKLLELQRQYNNLSANDRVTIGEGLQKQMAGLAADIETAKKQFVSLSAVSEDSIEGMTLKLMELNKQYKALSASDRDTVGPKLAQDMALLSGEIDKANLKLRATAGSLGATTKGWDGLGYSVQQVARELPNAAISPQLFIMAISNNLPILADNIARVRAENAALNAENKVATPVWKQVASSIFSWQTALVLGITAATMWGDKIGGWLKTLLKSKDAIQQLKDAQEELRQTTIKGQQDAEKDVTRLQLLYNAATDATAATNDRKAAVDELQKMYPDYLGNINDEAIKTGQAAEAYDRLRQSIIDAAIAKAYESKITEAQSKIIELDGERALKVAEFNKKIASSSVVSNTAGGSQIRFGIGVAKADSLEDDIKKIDQEIATLFLKIQEYSKNINIKDLLFGNKNQVQDSKVKATIDELKGEYQRLEDSIRKTSDAVLNASEKERPALQEKLNLLVQQKQAWDDLIKSQRGETTGLKPLAVTAQVSGSEKQSPIQLGPMKQLTDEQRKQLEAKAKQVTIEEKIKENEEERNEIMQSIVSLIDETVQKYGEMLGLSKDQQDVLKNSVNAMKGMAQIASGNVIQGSFTLLASTVDMLVKAPEKMSVHYENVQKQVEKIISSIETASEAMNNIGKNSSFASLQVIKSQILGLADDAKKLNDELAKSSTGRRRETNLNLPSQDMVKQAADLNAEIEKLTTRLLRGDISDDQRKAIEAILDTYNTLVQQFNSTIQDLIGTNVPDFGMALSDAILSGADAWNVWEQKATDVIKRVTSKQLYAKLIEKPITDAVNTLVNDSADGLSAEESKNFTDIVKGIYETVEPAYKAATEALKTAGIDLTSTQSPQSPITGISSQLTEETGSLIAGIGTAIRIDVKSLLNFSQNQLSLMDSQLSTLNQIEKNTRHNAELPGIKSELQAMTRIMNERL